MHELVSIIMPSFNTGGYIKESIESIINQTYNFWELIIVDDCSTDNTDEIVASIKDERIVFIKNSVNRGAAVCRNIALRLAKGRWIAFLDSDDLWYPNKLEQQISFMKENDFSFSYTSYEEIDDMGNCLGKSVMGPKRITRFSMFNYCWPGCLTVMYDRKVVGLVQITDIKKNNDYAMWLEVIKKTNCFLLEDVLAKYRRREGSISNNSYISLIGWHYKLYRDVEKQNIVSSIFNTIRNIIFGMIKKIVYVKKL